MLAPSDPDLRPARTEVRVRSLLAVRSVWAAIVCLTGPVTFPGLGSADWVELDLDVFDIEQQVNVRSLIETAVDTVTRLVGPHYDVEPANDGTAHIVVDGTRRYHAEVNAGGRLVLTVVPDPEGPL